jgi:hypothetical protein
MMRHPSSWPGARAPQNFSRVGEGVVGRSLNVRPTITSRPSHPVRVLVTRELALGPGGWGPTMADFRQAGSCSAAVLNRAT